MSENDEWAHTPDFTPEPDPEEPIEEGWTEDLQSEIEEPIQELTEDIQPEIEESTQELTEDTQPEQPKLDLNRAEESELRELAGIGEVLSARIVGYRTEVQPFQDPSEITQVKGISQAMYESLADRLTVSPPEPEPWGARALDEIEIEAGAIEAPEVLEPEIREALEMETPEALAGIEAGLEAEAPEIEKALETEPGEEPEKPPIPKPARGPEPPLVEVQTIQKAGWGRLLLVGILCSLLGAALSLGVLFFTNGTLDFRAAADRALRTESLRLQGQVDTLDSQQTVLDERLQALQDLTPALEKAQSDIEGLGLDLASAQARMDRAVEDLAEVQASLASLEDRTGGVEKQVSELQAQANAIQEQIEVLGGDIETLQAAAGRFDAFLTGLRELLDTGEEANSPQLTPMPEAPAPETPEAEESPTAEPGVTVMPTVQPRITVIPLATPTPSP